MTVILLPLRVDEVTSDDVKWMERVLVDSEDGYDVGAILALAAANRCRIWRCMGGGEGIVITSLEQQPNGVNCIIWFLAGKNLIRWGSSLFEQLSHYAKAQGANSLIAHTRSEGLMRVFARAGFKQVSVKMAVEV